MASRFLLWPLFGMFFGACSTPEPELTPFQSVDPFIGTGGHGHTYPGATAPFGLVQLSPDTRLEGWDGCSGYHFTDEYIYGFSHTHLSGTGVPDYGDVLLMPGTGELRFHNGAGGQPGYRSLFRKNTETAEPGYYTVYLEDSKVKAELTATERVGLHRYIFDQIEQQAYVLLDLAHRDRLLGDSLRVVSDTEIEGARISTAWAREQHVYFVARFSKPFTEVKTDSLPKAAFLFDLKNGDTLLVKVGISAVDIEGARRNLDAEMPGWDFEAVRKQTAEKWAQVLGKVEIEADAVTKRNFYTALYHNYIVPNIFSDADGRYRGLDQQIHQAGEHPQYTVFSIWDTYRATHPLYTILEADRTNDFIHSFLRHHEQGGELPVWELAGNETYCMIGYNSVSVIADAYLKGIRDYDAEKAMEAMLAISRQDKFGKIPYGEWGFIPSELEGESVSKTLEYAYDDWCIAQMARAMGKDDISKDDISKDDIYVEYTRRAQSYKNIFDPETRFMRAKNRHRWYQPFDPTEVNFNYTEANSWQYSFYVPQDVNGWKDLLGGEGQLTAFLDELFTADSKTTGREQADITGLIGQYAHGNEPSHHMAYLYNYDGAPWKTQEKVWEIMSTLYHDAPDGLSGNEDCGQMSAWYVFSALGFYPVCPGSNEYAIGTPKVRSAVVHLENGKDFKVMVKGKAKGTPYIQSVRLNGQPYSKNYIRHEDITAGGELEIEVGEAPNKEWGSNPEDRPSSRIAEHLITPVPALSSGKRSFDDADTIALNCALKDAQLFYSLDGSEPATLYEGPIPISQTTKLKAKAVHPASGESKIIEVELVKRPRKVGITLAHPYGRQYTAGGDEALVDGLTGGPDFRTGEWQGYEQNDLDAALDLGEAVLVKEVSIRFLQDENAWVFYPERVEFFTSADGQNWKPLGTVETKVSPYEPGILIQAYSQKVNAKTRYLRVVGVNRGVCPPGHKGEGGKAWVFADEILLKF
ncbi:MAG: GH92 family glycosyl hydrolase [Saprospiraceae bacterium]